jgi:hypothetical protein
VTRENIFWISAILRWMHIWNSGNATWVRFVK